MVMATKALLAQTPSPDEAAVRATLSGQVCRCSGYGALVAAIVSLGEGGADG
jgi:aerobic carbon-monoxide dehydrogenase small subunit